MGVPGTLKSTTFLSAHSLLASYVWGMPQAVASVSVMGAHLQHQLAVCSVTVSNRVHVLTRT